MSKINRNRNLNMIRIALSVLCIVCLFSSCTDIAEENYKKMQAIINEYNAKLVYGEYGKNGYLVYYVQDSKEMYYQNFESELSREVLLEKGQEFIVKEYVPEITSDGKINILSYTRKAYDRELYFFDEMYSEVDERGYYTSLCDYKGDLNNHAILFYGDDKPSYLFCSSSPDTLIRFESNSSSWETLDFKGYIRKISNSMWKFPGFENYFAKNSKESIYEDYDAFYYFDRGGGMGSFAYDIGVDIKGKLHINIPGLDNSTVICNWDSDLPFVTVPLEDIRQPSINNYLHEIVEIYNEKFAADEIEELNNNAITLPQLSSEFKNQIKSENLIGREMIIKCEIERVERADGLFDPNGYKYKMRSAALEAFGEWISGYDLIGYTNDENCIELDYPSKVIMKCSLSFGNRREFIFKDCQILLH